MNELLTRNEFKKQVFQRERNTCAFCSLPAVDAHHIIERRLWTDGGFYLNNGVAVCAEHHIECEKTNISIEQVREVCGIKKPIIPEHLYSDQIYDKWGNIILPNGTRLKGELFHDESVQKILSDWLHVFTNLVKYPRTYHLPFSKNMNEDDRMLSSMDSFKDKRVVVTVKMDGENTTMYNDYIHARSLDSQSNITRSWVKNFWSNIKSDIPAGYRICGENLFAKHSIQYLELPSYFMGFSIWNEKNECLSWDETQEWFNLLDIESVPVLYDNIFDEKAIRGLFSNKNWETMEGYVIRLADKFSYGEFNKKVGKFVRKNHIQTVKHWMHGQPLEKNKLKKGQ